MAKVRIFKLGSLEHRILPSEQAIQRFASFLRDWDGQGDLNIIWGPDVEVVELEVAPEDLIIIPKTTTASDRHFA